MKTHLPFLFAALAFSAGTLTAAPVGTAFTYQGRLNDGGNPANGIYDLRFTIYDASSGPAQVGPALTNAATGVTNGLFTVTLDFGQGIFTGDARWLEIGVRTNGAAGFTMLTPRQSLTPAPHALYAPSAGTAVTALGTAAGAISNLNLASSAVTSDKIADGTIVAPDLSPAVLSNTFWRLGGNAGTTAGTQFLGTTDNQPLEFKVNNTRALRLEPDATSPNVIGGFDGNVVSAGYYGSTIGGGGSLDHNHTISANFGTISGGDWNTIQTDAWGATIAGGDWNTIQTDAGYATVSGGSFNRIHTNAWGATIGGGMSGWIAPDASCAAIGGGYANSIRTNAFAATIGGGNGNSIQTDALRATVSGGYVNTIGASATNAAIGGGEFNTIAANAVMATIPGGQSNVVAGAYGFAAGRRAKVNQTGAFVWADSTDADFASTDANQFLIRAAGGVGINTNNPQSALHVNGVVTATGFTGSAASLTSLNASALASGTVPSAQLSGTYSGVLTFNNAANSYSGSGAGLTALNASQLTTGTVDDARITSRVARTNQVWLLGGNAGTTPGTHFLGTTDNQPLELKVNGVRALRLVDNGDGSDSGTVPDGAPNVIGGSPGNFVAAGVVGAAIAGGGATNRAGVAGTNSVLADYGTVGGGLANRVETDSYSATIGGGDNNDIAANSPGATIAGGYWNDIGTNASYSAIGGGYDNNIAASSGGATIAGGVYNNIGTNAYWSAIGGGHFNTNTGLRATVGGGVCNLASGAGAVIGGGGYDGTSVNGNTASGPGSVIGGGTQNLASGSRSTIGGGHNNTATNTYAAVPGGAWNLAGGTGSFAAGQAAKAVHDGAFVWSDSFSPDVVSTNANSVTMRASGGYRLFSNNGMTAGVYLAPGGGSWTSMSDRNAKENVTPVNSREVLSRVAALPLAVWNYKSQDATIRHLGPMAQDFHAAFGLGESDTGITGVDADGVALAAIQGLNQKLEETRAENADLKRELAELKQVINSLTHQLPNR